MDAFAEACKVEAKAMDDLRSFAQMVSDGHYVETAKGTHSQKLQMNCGDLVYTSPETGEMVWVEIKSERSNAHGNFFLETWSNRNIKRQGWLRTCRADWLWYYFLDSCELFLINRPRLKRWAYGGKAPDGTETIGNLPWFPEKGQGKYDQDNDARGVCVPIAVIVKEVTDERYILRDNVWRKLTSGK